MRDVLEYTLGGIVLGVVLAFAIACGVVGLRLIVMAIDMLAVL